MAAQHLQEQLKTVLEDEELCLIFEEFLVHRFAWENLGFWLDVEEYKTLENLQERVRFAHLLYDKYLKPNSPFELGDVDTEMRDLIFSCLNNPPPKIFNILQHKVFVLMAHTTISDFLRDEIYKNYQSSKNPQQPPVVKKPDHYDFIYKIVLGGTLGAGKSSMLSQYIRQDFKYSPTQGVEFEAKIVSASGKSIKFQIWDTAEQERYNAITSAYFRGAYGAIVVYDITDKKSFTDVEYWVNKIREIAVDNVVILLIGNKLDRAAERKVSVEEGRNFAEKNKMLFMEVSAKTAENVNDAFRTLMSRVHEETGEDWIFDETNTDSSILLDNVDDSVPSKQCRC